MTDEALSALHSDPIPEPEVETEVQEPKVEPKKARSAKGTFIKDHDDAILELRHENANLRKKLDELAQTEAEKLAAERIEAAKTEAKAAAEKLLDEYKQSVEEKTRSRVLKAELKAAASRAGVVDFDDAFMIMQKLIAGKVEFDDDGGVKNALELVAKFKEEKPYLFAGVNTSSTEQAPMSRQNFTEKSALEMSRDEYRKARAKLASL